jgi:hypothetical protein
MSAHHSLLTFVLFNGVVKRFVLCYSLYLVLPEPETIQQLSDEHRWNLLQHRRFEIRITQSFEILRSRGIEPVLIKGWAAALNYPDEKSRVFADIDLAVPRDQYKFVLELSRSAPLSSMGVDVHRELRHLDSAPWSELFERSRLTGIDDYKIRVLAPEDHLRVLCTHWLTDGGQYRDRLWDIYYAIKNRPLDFDWKTCLGEISRTRKNWILTAIAITRDYLELDVSDLPFVDELNSVPEWVKNCLEEEWASDVRLRPLQTCLYNKTLLLQQIKKRIPPNPIQATIESEAKFDESSRVPLQFKSVMLRLVPSLNRVGRSIADKLRRSQPS